MKLTLKKDFIYQQSARLVDPPDKFKAQYPQVEKIKRHDVGVEAISELQQFYTRNYYPGYILGNKKLFIWLFRNNGGRVAVLSVADKIIAHQGHVPVVFTDGETDYRGFISASTMVDKDYRRLGLMSLLRGSVQKRYEMALSIGGSAKGIALYSAMDYQLYGHLIRKIAIVDLQKCQGLTKNPDQLKATVQLTSEQNKTVKKITSFTGISQELNDLISQVLPAQKYFGVKRDSDFFNWRYLEHPIFNYQAYGWWEQNKLKALIIFRHEQIKGFKPDVIRITELIGQGELLVNIVKATVLSELESSTTAWIDFFCAHEKISHTLEAAGFKSPDELQPSVIPIFCSPIDYEKENYPVMFWAKDEEFHKQLPPLANWYLTKGDGDADRPNTVANYIRQF